MGEKRRALKLAMLEQDGSIRNTYDRIVRKNGERISLGRLYRVIGGYSQPTQEERTLLCQILQRPAKDLFPEA